MFASHGRCPFTSSGSVNIFGILHPRLRPQRCFMFPSRPFGSGTNSIHRIEARRRFSETSSPSHEISLENGLLIEYAQEACWHFSNPQVAQTAVYMKGVEIMFHCRTHISPLSRAPILHSRICLQKANEAVRGVEFIPTPPIM